MALASVLDLVKIRLPFLPTDGSMDTTINSLKIEQYYFLSKWTGLTTEESIEDDTEYTGILRLLVVRLVCYELVVRKVIQVVGGVGGANPTGSRQIKKGKADVVEAEFSYAKASDGSVLSMEATNLIDLLLKEVCQYATTLQYDLPLCSDGSTGTAVIPAFKSYSSNNNCGCGPRTLWHHY